MAEQYPDQPSLQIAPVVVVFFLRFLVPAIADPYAYGILDPEPGQSPDMAPQLVSFLAALAEKVRSFFTWFLWRSSPHLEQLLSPSLPALTAFVDSISTHSKESSLFLASHSEFSPHAAKAHADAVLAAARDELDSEGDGIHSINSSPSSSSHHPHPSASQTLSISQTYLPSTLPVSTLQALATVHSIILDHWPRIRKSLELGSFPSPHEFHQVATDIPRDSWGAPSLLPPRNELYALTSRLHRSVPPDGPLQMDKDKTFSGHDLLAWIMAHTLHKEHYYAASLAQSLLDARLIHNVEAGSDLAFAPDETRFRLQEHEPARVLNRVIIFVGEARDPLVTARTLLAAGLILLDSFSNMRGDAVARHLKLLRSSSAFRAFALASAELQAVVLDGLDEVSKWVFFVNVYNAAYIHAAIAYPPPSDPLRRASYERKAKYHIGPLGAISLWELEHAVLRAAAPSPPSIPGYRGSFPSYDSFEPRAGYVLSRFEPRLMFVLSHGTLNSPAVSILEPDTLAQNVYDATCRYIQNHTVVDIRKQAVTLPSYIRTYANDLGGSHKAILYFVLEYTTPSIRASLQSIIQAGMTLSLAFEGDDNRNYYSISISNAVLPSFQPLTGVRTKIAGVAATAKAGDASALSGTLTLPSTLPAGDVVEEVVVDGYVLVDDPRPPKVWTKKTKKKKSGASPSSGLPAASPAGPTLVGGTSDILDETLMSALWSWVPARYREDDLVLAFKTSRDGYSLSTLVRNSTEMGPALLVIKTTCGSVIGGYLSTGVELSSSFRGTGQTFLFSLAPEIRRYTWRSGRPAHFVRVTESQLCMGGGAKGYGLWIDAELLHGGSIRCRTFANDPLVPGGDTSFECTCLELWVFSSEADVDLLLTLNT